MTGIVKFYSERGYGFITCDEDGEDYYVHITDCIRQRQLTVGQAVHFDASDNPRFPNQKRAVNVCVMETVFADGA